MMVKLSAALLGVGFALLTITGCASAEKKASELMENGAYEDAESAYDAIVKTEPDNAEARVGLANARAKVIDSRLLSIRKARMSGQRTEDALMAVIALENRWQTQPPGPAAFTQKEEVDFATKIILSELRNPNLSRLPLKREYSLRHFEPLFQVSHASEFASLRKQTQGDGRAMCASFSNQAKGDLVYISNFTKRFCDFWKSNGKTKTSDDVVNKNLFREISLAAKLEGFPSEAQKDLAIQLNNSLRLTPWYSAFGKEKLNIKASGTWNQNIQRNTTQLLHQYSVQESYIESVSVAKTRQVPRTSTTYAFNSLTGTSDPITTTHYENETYYESEPQTKWHSVEKTYPYGGWSINQSLKISIDGSTSLQDQGIQLSVHDESSAQDTESDVSYPGIGLQPKVASSIPNPSLWLKNHEEDLGKQLFVRLSAIWADSYCSEKPADTYGVAGNRVHQCLRLQTAAAQPPKFVEEWYQKFLGLSYGESERLLSKAL